MSRLLPPMLMTSLMPPMTRRSAVMPTSVWTITARWTATATSRATIAAALSPFRTASTTTVAATFVAGKFTEFLDDVCVVHPTGFNLILQKRFDTRQSIDIAVTDQTERMTLFAGPTGATDAVNVILRVIWKLVIHNHVDT